MLAAECGGVTGVRHPLAQNPGSGTCNDNGVCMAHSEQWPFRAVTSEDLAKAKQVIALFDVVIIFEHLHRPELVRWLGWRLGLAKPVRGSVGLCLRACGICFARGSFDFLCFLSVFACVLYTPGGCKSWDLHGAEQRSSLNSTRESIH